MPEIRTRSSGSARDVDHLKHVIDTIRRQRRRGAKITGTKTLVVLDSTLGIAGRAAPHQEP